MKKIKIGAAAVAANIIAIFTLVAWAYAERGYRAIGGEWCLILAITIFNILFLKELAKAKEATDEHINKRNTQKRG